MDGAAGRPVVGLLGAFDTGELGEVALRRVIEMELARRRPDIDLVAVAPYGAERPTPADEGCSARPLGRLGDARLPDREPALDCLIIAGDVLATDDQWAERYPVDPEAMAALGVASLVLTGELRGAPAAPSILWFAVGAPGSSTAVDIARLAGRDVWVRDGASQKLLGGTSVQSGDPVLLAGRVFAPETLRRRADLLRLCGALPEGRRLVIEAMPGRESPTAARLDEVILAALRADPKLSVVVLALDASRQTSMESPVRPGGLLAERVHHFPAWAGLDDVAAGMSGAAGVVATSPAGAHLAASLGAPVAALTTSVSDRTDPAIPILPEDLSVAVQMLLANTIRVAIEKSVQTLDGAFAELAERLPRSPASKARTHDEEPVQSALSILQQRLVDERTALQAELSRLQAEVDHLRGTPEHRITQPIREGYRRWQRRRT